MKNSVNFAVALVAIAALPTAGFGQLLSNGTGGGLWTDTSTWAGGVVPTGSAAFNVTATDVVDGSGSVLILNNNNNSRVLGTLNLNGSNIEIGRFNNALETFGTVNVNGGRLSVARMSQASTSRLIMNVSAGLLEQRELNSVSQGVTYNISGGRVTVGGDSINTHNTAGTGAIIHLTGGSLEFAGTNGFKNASALLATNGGSWNGGRVSLNTSAEGSTNIITAWSTNAVNELAISSKETQQTFTLNGAASATQGNLIFNIYSPNDNDVFIASSFDFSSNVHIKIEGVNLAGTVDDYVGQSFQILDPENDDYSSILATIDLADLTIGGTLYEGIMFVNNLDVDGTISLAAIPEPSTYAILFGSLVLGLAIVRRRAAA